jgi:hypothetical protein
MIMALSFCVSVTEGAFPSFHACAERLRLPAWLASRPWAQWCADLLVRQSASAEAAVRQAARAHLALFYLGAGFYHLSKRFVAARHVVLHSVRPGQGPDFRVLGGLMLGQLAISLLLWL